MSYTTMLIIRYSTTGVAVALIADGWKAVLAGALLGGAMALGDYVP